MKLDPIESILEDVRLGRPVVMIDDKDRENEGDLMVAAERIRPDTMNMMLQTGKGLVCISITEEQRRALGLPMQVTENSSPFGTNFAVSFDHISVADTGASASSRATTILAAVSEHSGPKDFLVPGCVFPVVAVPGGVLKRQGQTEGSVDLARLAGLKPAGVICEIMGDKGEMLRGAKLEQYCAEHQLKITSVDEILQYRLHHELAIRLSGEVTLSDARVMRRSPILEKLFRERPEAPFRIMVFVDDVDDKEHIAFVCGEPKDGCLTRIHSECLTGDIFGSRRCDCGSQLSSALELILQSGDGVLVYLHQEGRGIGLGNKLRAYELQEKGLDTVDANLHLGFAVDSRDYRVAAHILSSLGITSVRLLTNNPDKVSSLRGFGINVSERVSLPVQLDEFNRDYILAKKDRLGHLFEFGS